MIYFLGWVLFILAVIAAVPIAFWIDNRDRKPVEIEEEEPVEEVEEMIEEMIEEVEVIEETEMEKRLRRLRIISESMSQEEMFAHGRATLELATMLHSKGRLREANQALEILTSQPGIGDRYRIRALTKHGTVLRALDRISEFDESQKVLQDVYSNLLSEDPDTAASVLTELSEEEAELINNL